MLAPNARATSSSSSSTAFSPAGPDAGIFSASPAPAGPPQLSGSAAPEMIAHEAAHVVQQSAGRASPSPYAGMF